MFLVFSFNSYFQKKKIKNMIWKLIGSICWTNSTTIFYFKVVSRGQFHQRFYAQLLCPQIPKVQKAAWVDWVFYAFGICRSKRCEWTRWWNWPQVDFCVRANCAPFGNCYCVFQGVMFNFVRSNMIIPGSLLMWSTFLRCFGCFLIKPFFLCNLRFLLLTFQLRIVLMYSVM